MPYIVRLRKTDGTVVDLPDIYPGDAPCDQNRIAIPFHGGTIEGKVERCLERHEFNGTSASGVQTVPVVVVTMLRWINKKHQGTGN
ncbi:MAG TPA: hypothetical protein VFW28_05815 [Micropepsaceae bacterium]|nr:hypothetical protein [Micropepsaceae bacterium]